MKQKQELIEAIEFIFKTALGSKSNIFKTSSGDVDWNEVAEVIKELIESN